MVLRSWPFTDIVILSGFSRRYMFFTLVLFLYRNNKKFFSVQCSHLKGTSQHDSGMPSCICGCVLYTAARDTI